MTFVGTSDFAKAEQAASIQDDSMVLQEAPKIEETNLVEVKSPASYFSNYRDRRTTHSLLFSFSQSKILMDELSTDEGNDTLYYDEIYGDESVAFSEIYIGYKFNFSLGALHLDGGYGVLEKTESFSGQKRTLEIRRPSVRLGYIADTLFSEPYIAPYISAAAWKMNIKDANEVDSVSYVTDIGFTYSAGILIQLNWIDPNSAFEVRKNFGVQNTYLDAFVTKQTQTVDPDDPDTSTDLAYGVGLRIEY